MTGQVEGIGGGEGLGGPSWLVGALVGLLLGGPLLAVFLVADTLAGLTLPAFDVFDWLARSLPGPLVTLGIDALVVALSALSLDVATAAKAAEQGLALAGQLVSGAVVGAVLFGLARRWRWLGGLPGGLLAGSLAGALVALVVLDAGRTAADALWVLVACSVWGAMLGWTWQGLAEQTAAPSQVLDAGRAAVQTAAPSQVLDAGRAAAQTAAPSQMLDAGRAAAQTAAPSQMLDAGRAAAQTAAPSQMLDAGRAPDDASKGVVSLIAVERLSRRQFLVRLGAATAAVTVVGAGLSALVGSSRRGSGTAGAPTRAAGEDTATLTALPNADDPLQPAPGTRPEYTPLDEHYRIDINTRPPEVDGAAWRLSIDGLVERPAALTLAELQANYEPLHQFVTLSCISNRIGGGLISTTLWTGASLQDVLADVGVLPGASQLEVRSADGFFEYVALDLVAAERRVMLAYHWDGQPLRPKHGFPLRIYIPDRYGMKQPKWITSIRVIDEQRQGYWVVRGWDERALVRATAVIDTVAVDEVLRGGSGVGLVPVGGIAYAGARGISKVEVKVDDGPWRRARLRSPLSETTWVVWRYDWPFEAGQHTFFVRCYDGGGRLQVMEEHGPRPSGATGVHSVSVSV